MSILDSIHKMKQREIREYYKWYNNTNPNIRDKFIVKFFMMNEVQYNKFIKPNFIYIPKILLACYCTFAGKLCNRPLKKTLKEQILLDIIPSSFEVLYNSADRRK